MLFLENGIPEGKLELKGGERAAVSRPSPPSTRRLSKISPAGMTRLPQGSTRGPPYVLIEVPLDAGVGFGEPERGERKQDRDDSLLPTPGLDNMEIHSSPVHFIHTISSLKCKIGILVSFSDDVVCP